MIKDYFLNKVESAVEKAIEAGKLGQMTELKTLISVIMP